MKALFIICISGFTQNRSYCHGIIRLREELILSGYHGLAKRVWYCRWKDKMRLVAGELEALCKEYSYRPTIVLTGYSYGGWGALRLARRLQERDMLVSSLILCDPVGRPWYWPRPLPAATSLLGRRYAPSLTVPTNVARLLELYQTESRIQGHTLKLPHNSPTNFVLSQRLQEPHTEMDDVSFYHLTVLEEANNLLRPSHQKAPI